MSGARLEPWLRGPMEAAVQGLIAAPRAVGRAGLPWTGLGLLFHAAEHASRHTGQVISTAKLIGDR